MKTLKQNKIITTLLALFMAICAVIGITAAPLLSASADEAGFDWTPYDDANNYTETVLYEYDAENTTTFSLDEIFNKPFRFYGKESSGVGTVVTFSLYHSEDTYFIFNFEPGSPFWADGTMPPYSYESVSADELSGIFYEVAEDNSYVNLYMDENAKITVESGEYPLNELKISSSSFVEKLTVLELNEADEPITGSGGSSVENNKKPQSADKLDAMEAIFLVGLAFVQVLLLSLCAMKLPRSGKGLALAVLLLLFVAADLGLYMAFAGII